MTKHEAMRDLDGPIARALGVAARSDGYPHAGGCAGCRSERKCNVCAASVDARTRCTNGRCDACHRSVCGGGIAHGFGSVERACAASRRARRGEARR